MPELKAAKGEGTRGPLVSAKWVEEHQNDKNVRLVEVDVDKEAYGQGHLVNAIGWNWETDLSDRVRRDIIPKESLEQLLGSSGIDRNTTIVVYGDNNNWFACWAYWQLKLYRHPDLRVLDGGRRKWIADGRPLTRDVPSFGKKVYVAGEPDGSIRALLPEVQKAYAEPTTALVDVRSGDEYTGKILAPPGLPETCQRGGHIPRAVSVPWGKNVQEDGTFRTEQELKNLYASLGVTPDKEVVAYCRIGERSSLTWFVLKELLGYEKVRNYDGSWTEWGNLVRAPVERGPA